MADLKDFLNKFTDAVSKAYQRLMKMERTIKDVESWDGAAANYPDTGSYCKACLIDANPAAGLSGEDIIQANCKLPVREAGDPSTTYVRQAVYAAAGGRGITAVTKPEDVPADAWDALVVKAAKEIIAAYKEMDELAPDSVYDKAGLAHPERINRAVTLNAAVWAALDALGKEAWIVDVYLNGDGVLLLLNVEGKLYSMPLAEASDGSITSGELTEINVVGPSNENRIQIIRQADGKHRWFAQACSAVLNKAGAIDSRELFDDFVKRFNEGQSFTLRFYHDERIEFGDGDWLGRSDNLLLASGTFREDHPMAQAVIKAAEAGTLDWPGTSIGFFADGEVERLTLDQEPGIVEIPVYTRGWMEEISFLDEADACSFMTRFVTGIKQERMTRMDEREKAAIYKLYGDENKDGAEAFITSVDETNRVIKEKDLLTREVPTTEQEPQPTTEEPTVTPAENAPSPEPRTDPMMPIVEAHNQLATKVEETIGQFNERMISIEARISELAEAVGKLSQTDEQKHEEWIRDLPPAKNPVTYRPRDVSRATPVEKVGSDIKAAQVLDKLPK